MALRSLYNDWQGGRKCSAQSEAISRLISLALRSDHRAREIVRQLKGISGPTPVWDGHGGQNPEHAGRNRKGARVLHRTS